MSTQIFKSNKSEGPADMNIELSASQATILNFLLPCRYRLDFTETKNFRTVIST